MPELVPDQVEGVKWILEGFQKHKGVILADKCGLGKTAQAIDVSKYALQKHKDPVLIIVPAYLIYNWLDELELWSMNKSVCTINSTKQILHEADIYLVSYNMVTYKDRKTGKHNIFEQLFKKSYSLIICDESHALQAWGSKRSKAILGNFRLTKNTLKARTKKFLLLTGTPILNNVEELYNLVVRIAPGCVNNMSRMDFILNFAGSIKHTSWGLKHHGVKNEDQLKEMLKGCMLQRTIIEGLPSRVDRDIILDVKGAELKRLIQEENEFLLKIGIDPDDLKKDLKLSSLDMSALAAVRQRTALFKIKFFMDILPDIIEKSSSIILYVYHRSVQIEVSTALKEKNINHSIINGSVSNKKRAEIVNNFQTGKNKIILATISSLKEGVNLQTGEAIIFLEHDYTPAAISQAIGRVHRRGQKNVVLVYHLLFNDGVDKFIQRILKRKQNMIDKIMGG